MKKKELRDLYKQKRLRLQHSEADRLQDLILIQFQTLALPFLHCVHAYLPMNNQNEVDTHPIMEFLKFSNPGITIAVPKINLHNHHMEHYVYDDDTVLEENVYHIPEPRGGTKVPHTDIDIVLVPLLAFDESGYRVGYGKGYYDRFLAECRKDVIKVGLSFFEAVPAIEDTDEFDISLTYCVTPQKIYEF